MGSALNSRCWPTSEFAKSDTSHTWGALWDPQYLQGDKIAVEGNYFGGKFVGIMTDYLSYYYIINNLCHIHGGEGGIRTLDKRFEPILP